jgi:GHMP kinases N terminal domain
MQQLSSLSCMQGLPLGSGLGSSAASAAAAAWAVNGLFGCPATKVLFHAHSWCMPLILYPSCTFYASHPVSFMHIPHACLSSCILPHAHSSRIPLLSSCHTKVHYACFHAHPSCNCLMHAPQAHISCTSLMQAESLPLMHQHLEHSIKVLQKEPNVGAHSVSTRALLSTFTL